MKKGFHFDEVKHIGRMNGEIWPSVTQLLQEAALIDYSNVPAAVLENKRLIGIRTHHAIQLLNNANLDEEDFEKRFPDCVGYLNAYKKFREIEPFDFSEDPLPRLHSQKWKFHGQPDEIGKHGRKTYLLDYKCTFKLFGSVGPQLRGYEILMQEKYRTRIDEFWGLQLKPTGNYEIVQFKDMADKLDFQSCLHLHWQRRHKYKTRDNLYFLEYYENNC